MITISSKKTKGSTRRLILNLLRSRGDTGATNEELSDITLRYGGRLGDLYKLGYKIQKTDLGNGLYKYVLIKEPDNEISERTSAFDLLAMALAGPDGCVARKQSELDRLFSELGISVRYKANTYNTI